MIDKFYRCHLFTACKTSAKYPPNQYLFYNYLLVCKTLIYILCLLNQLWCGYVNIIDTNQKYGSRKSKNPFLLCDNLCKCIKICRRMFSPSAKCLLNRSRFYITIVHSSITNNILCTLDLDLHHLKIVKNK